MFKANENFALMPESYLFSEVARRVSAYRSANPDAEIIRMDIGDVSLPLSDVVVKAMVRALEDMSAREGFHGYGPEQGYAFLRDKIADADYARRGIQTVSADDIFISDGAKSDIGNLGDLFGHSVKVAVCNPGYPVYVDANVIDGRAGRCENGKWSNLVYIECRIENGFVPSLPSETADVIYLCSPCNPTGMAMTRVQLKEWVDYALEHKSLIIFDSAYEAYIGSEDIARSIYEIPGAERCAIEVRSFSKSAGFTGVRCGYTVVPSTLVYLNDAGREVSLRKMWNRRQCTKFNGVGYVVQRGAEALYPPEGRKFVSDSTGYYMRNARMLRDALTAKGFEVVGGVNSPYVWFKSPDGENSWSLFDRILNTLRLSGTPGSGFGDAGEGWLRFTGFNTTANTEAAIKRFENL